MMLPMVQILKRPPQPVGAFCDDGVNWQLLMLWACRTLAGLLVILPGFLSDGASIPKLFWQLVSPKFDPRTFIAALAHDAMYAGRLASRSVCDRVFYELLLECGMGRAKSRLCWLGVRAGGWFYWRKHTADSIAAARKLASLKA